MTRSRALGSLAVVACVLVVSRAQAQQPLDKDADADRLFKEAQKLMEERRFADACPKLESAYRKDQQLGTLMNLAYCHKEQGSTWLSWVEFREAEAKAIEMKRTDRRDFARERMRELEKNLSRLIIDANPKYDLVEVDLEDKRIYDAEKGIAFAAEAGQRKVTFHAKGKKPAILLVAVAPKSEKIQHVLIPEMVDEDPLPPGPPDTGGNGGTNNGNGERPVVVNGSSWSTQKTLAIVAGVVGVGGVAVGTIFGLKTIGSECADNKPGCTPAQRNDASSSALISTISFAAGGAFLVGAVVLWLTAPSGSSTASSGVRVVPALGAGWTGLSGTF